MSAETHDTAGRGSKRNAKQLDFTELYNECYPRVYNYVYFRLLNKSETEDVVAETFTRAYAAFDRFDPSRASFTTWVFTIAHNCLVSLYRSRRPSTGLDDIPENALCENDEYPGLDDSAKQVRELLKCLSDEDRQIVFLKYHEEMRNSQIAELLGMNPSTVSTKLARALKKMLDASQK